jgi:hypothetical protein
VTGSVSQSRSISVTGSSFDLLTIQKVVRLVLHGALSLRAASRVLNLLDLCNGGNGVDAPSQTTIANLIHRIGLFSLQRVDQKRDDWVWLLDHTIAAGSTKCLIVLGISLKRFQTLGRPLCHQDLTVIGLMPVETSNGLVVHQQLNQLSSQFGPPLATLSDRGSDLRKGIEEFQQDHPGLIQAYDIVHLVSRVIKHLFEADPRWEAHRRACRKCANFLRQSQLAHLKPPKPKSKARHMNFDREVRWSARALWVLDRVRCGDLNDRQRERLPSKLVEERLGWLEEYRQAVGVWLEVIRAGQAIAELVRQTGYTASTIESIGNAAEQLQHEQSRELVRQVHQEIAPLSTCLPANRSLPGSTEVLESLIGKGKRLLAHSGNSLTRHVLSLSAATADITTELISQALSACRMKNVHAWARDHLTAGVHTQRNEDLTPSPEEENLRKVKFATTPNF